MRFYVQEEGSPCHFPVLEMGTLGGQNQDQRQGHGEVREGGGWLGWRGRPKWSWLVEAGLTACSFFLAALANSDRSRLWTKKESRT